MKVEAIKHTDVRGKTLNYVRVTNSKGENYLIQVGDKTLKAIEELTKEGTEIKIEDKELEKGEKAGKATKEGK